MEMKESPDPWSGQFSLMVVVLQLTHRRYPTLLENKTKPAVAAMELSVCITAAKATMTTSKRDLQAFFLQADNNYLNLAST